MLSGNFGTAEPPFDAAAFLLSRRYRHMHDGVYEYVTGHNDMSGKIGSDDLLRNRVIPNARRDILWEMVVLVLCLLPGSTFASAGF